MLHRLTPALALGPAVCRRIVGRRRPQQRGEVRFAAHGPPPSSARARQVRPGRRTVGINITCRSPAGPSSAAAARQMSRGGMPSPPAGNPHHIPAFPIPTQTRGRAIAEARAQHGRPRGRGTRARAALPAAAPPHTAANRQPWSAPHPTTTTHTRKWITPQPPPR